MNLEEITGKLSETDSRSRSNTHRIDRLEERQDDLDQLTAAMAGQQKEIEHMSADMREIKVDVKSLMDVPRSRWNTVITAAATAVVSAIVGAVLALILK